MVQRAQGKLAELSPRSRRMERIVYMFFVDWTLSTNYVATSGKTQRLSYPVSQIEPSVGPTVPAQKKKLFFFRHNF